MSKLFNVEVASVLQEKNIIELSSKKSADLAQDEREAIEILDNFAREVGKSGKSNENNTIVSELIKKSVEPLLFQPDNSIITSIFTMGSIGEFDETKYSGLPKNTIKVYDAVRGGNVPKSYVDPSVFTAKKFALQAETELDYSDLRRNGFKSIAKMTELTREAFENEMFYRLFAGIDGALDLVTGDQNIDGGSALTITAMDTFARYLRDWSEGDAFAVGLSKYLDPAYKMTGVEKYLSDEMKNELNRLGRVTMYDGVRLSSIPTAKKTANGNNLVPDKRIIGVAGNIGEMAIRGEMRMYETYDNNAEKVFLKFTGYDVDYAIYYLDKIARIKLS